MSEPEEHVEPVTDGEFAGMTTPDFDDGVPVDDVAEPLDAEHGDEA